MNFKNAKSKIFKYLIKFVKCTIHKMSLEKCKTKKWNGMACDAALYLK